MGDSELDEIRKQRLAQLQSQYKSNADGDSQGAKEEQARAQEDAKNGILSQILDQAARARLNTLMLCKPDKGKFVENMLVQMARSGQICTKIGESELINLLENINSKTKKETTVKFDRRRAAIDSDDDSS